MIAVVGSRRGAGTGHPPAGPGVLTEPIPPSRPGWRDPWMWMSVLAIVPLILHSLGAPLGEPAAEDWDFIHLTLLTGDWSLLNGGGSAAFWRPLPHQIYYLLCSSLILTQPLLIASLHAVMMAALAALAYRAARTRLPAPWAAVVATFPLLAESSRALVSWPDHMVELSFLFFSVLALHEAAFRRLPTAMAALLAALFCKEMAVLTALLLPWVPRLAPASGTSGPGAQRERWRWVLAAAAVTLGWGLAYLAVRETHHLRLPHALETAPGTVGTPWLVRYGWAIANSLRADFSLPMAGVRREPLAWGGLIALGLAAFWLHATRPEARARLRALRPLIVAGVIWFAATAVPLTLIYPFWMPHRAAFGSIGLALALAGILGTARPALLAGLVVLRLAMFAVSPGPPTGIAPLPPPGGAFLDFVKITRLQHLMVETRRLLAGRFPTLPGGARVGLFHPPLMAEYAYGGSRALQVWYRDTTLRWVRYEEFRHRPDLPLAAIVHYEPERTPRLMLLEPEAMRRYLVAGRRVRREDWRGALADLAAADSLQADTTARIFVSRVAGRRALCLLGLAESAEAEREARRGLTLWRECADARYSLASALAFTGRGPEARAQLDTLLVLYPDDVAARALHDSLATWTAEGR